MEKQNIFKGIAKNENKKQKTVWEKKWKIMVEKNIYGIWKKNSKT